MAKQWNPEQRKIAEVILKHRREGGSGYDLRAVQEELPNTVLSQISKVASALKINNWVIPEKEPESKPSATQTGGQLGTVRMKKPGVYVFEFGQHNIELEPEPLIESYILYTDMKAKLDLEDSFSEAIKDAIGMAWRLLVSKPAIQGEKVTVEVKDDRLKEQAGTGVRGTQAA